MMLCYVSCCGMGVGEDDGINVPLRRKNSLKYSTNVLVLFCRVLSHVLGIQSWSLLLLKTTITSCIGLVALQLYLTLTTGKQART